MAGTPYIDNWVSVELVCNYAGQIVETIFNYKTSDMAITEGDMTAFGTAWISRMTSLLQATMNVGCQLVNVRCKSHFSSFPNVEAIVNFPSSTFGTVTGDGSPGNVTLAIKLLTGITGRKNRGRQFWPGIGEQSTILNTAGSSLIANIGVVFVQHLLGFVVASHTYKPAVASRKGLYIREVVNFAIDQYLDSQRRRLSNRGR